MVNFKANDYIEYNTRYAYFQYGYLHRLLDLLYKVCKTYKLTHENLIFWESDTGNQAELKNTIYLNINKRVFLHKKIFKELWQKRYKTNKNIVKQLKLF